MNTTEQWKSISLIAMDMDMTLLNSKKEITAKSLKTLRRAADAGIHIVPASGRNLQGIDEKLLQIADYAILINGSMIVSLHPYKVLMLNTFSPEEGLSVYQFLRDRYPEAISVFIDGGSYMEEDQKQQLSRFVNAEMAAFYKKNRISVADIKAKILQAKYGINKVGLVLNEETQKDFRIHEDVSSLPPCVMVNSGGAYDISPKNTGKEPALRKLSELLHIPMEQVMAFGDAENDIDMIRTAGVGIAMANATEAVKKTADAVTLSNDQDGVAAAVERVLDLKMQKL